MLNWVAFPFKGWTEWNLVRGEGVRSCDTILSFFWICLFSCLTTDVVWVCVYSSVGGSTCLICLCCLYTAWPYFSDLSDMCRSFWPRSSLPNMTLHGSLQRQAQDRWSQRRTGKEKGKQRKGRRKGEVASADGGKGGSREPTSEHVTREEEDCPGEKQAEKRRGDNGVNRSEEWGNRDLGCCSELWDMILKFRVW